MKFVGKYLKKARISKKISIEDVANELKISKQVINDIEEDILSDTLNKVYLIGHLRSYAKLLNLDSDEIIKNYNFQTHNDDYENQYVLPTPLVNNHLFIFSKSIPILSIIFISFIFYYFFIKSNDLQPYYSITSDLPENLQSEIEEFEMKSDIAKLNKEKLENNSIELINNNFVDNSFNNKLNINESSVIALTTSNNTAENFNNKIILKFLEPTWIQLRNQKEDIIFSKLMDKDEEYSYFISDNYKLTAGNAGNIIIKINDQTIGKLGKKGEVLDSILIHSEFNN